MSFVAPLLFILASGAAADRDAYALAGTQFAQFTIERRLIIRIPAPTGRRSVPPAQRPLRWKEKRGPSCMPMKSIVGAAITQDDSLDLILNDQSRIRARLTDPCSSADFYLGFYMEQTGDDQLCAARDVIHARNGAMCEIDEFKRLVAEK